jgi:nitroreductase
VSQGQVEQFLRSRRSIRQYRERAVEPGVLARLLRLASSAPSGHNSQPLEWLVLSGPEEIRRVSALVADWMRRVEKEQPQAFQLMHMDRVLQAAAAGEDRILRGAPHLIVAHAPKDNRMAPAAAVTALAYLELAATSLDLGTCWAGYFTAAAAVFPPLQEALGLPEGHVTYGAAMVGYPAVRYARIPLRRQPPITWRHGHRGPAAPRP